LDEIVSAAGYPAATLPLGVWSKGIGANGRPFGLVAIAGEWGEGTLVKVMSAWEATLGSERAVPDLGFLDE